MALDILKHPAVLDHLGKIARGERIIDAPAGWDPVDYAALDVPAIIIDPADKQPMTNPAKYGVKWANQPAAPQPLPLDASVGANGKAVVFVDRPGMQGGDIEFTGFVCKSTDRFSALPKSNTLNLELANRAICSTLLMGRGVVGSPWPASFLEPGAGFVQFECSNRVNVTNNARIWGVGRRFIGEEAQATIEHRRAKFLGARINPFFVGPDSSDDGQVEFTLFGNSTLDLQCTLPSVGDFLSIGLRDDSSWAQAGFPDFSMTIKDGVSGYYLMGDASGTGIAEPMPVDLLCAMSLALIDPRLPAPSFDGNQAGLFTHVFARSSKILLHYENNTNHDITVRQAFPGVLLRYKPAPNRDTNTSVQNRAEILARAQPVPYGNVVQGGRS